MKRRKWLSLLLCLALVISSLSVTAAAQTCTADAQAVGTEETQEAQAEEIAATGEAQAADAVEESAQISDAALGAATSASTAISAAVGTTYRGTSAAFEEIWYEYTLSSAGCLTVTAATAGNYVRLKVYGSADTSTYNYLDYETSSSGTLTMNYDLTAGTYYVVVYTSSYEVSYTLSTSFASAGESFAETEGGSNNSIDTADSISTGTTYKGQLALNDDTDYYTFTLSKSGSVTINATLTEGDTYFYFYVYDSSKSELWYEYAAGSETQLSETIDLTSGTYYLKAYAYAPYRTGNYTFNLSFSSAGESFAEPNGGNNNTKSTADSISTGKTYKGQIAVNDTIDWYKFTVSKKTTLTLSVTSYANATFYIYKSSGSKVDGSYCYDGNSTSDTMTLSKGTYYLQVSGSTYGTGNYSFKIGTEIAEVKLSSYTYVYNGKKKTPTVKVYNTNGTRLTQGTDYTVKWSSSSRKAIGQYTVTVTGKGSYSGTLTASFSITPKKVSISKATKSSASKKITVKWTKVSGSVSEYEIRYRKKGTSTWKTKTVSASKSSKTISGLKSGKSYEIQVRAIKYVSSSGSSYKVGYVGAWSNTKTVKVK